MIKEGNILYIYVDGKNVASQTSGASMALNLQNGSFYLGALVAGQRNTQGKLDELALFKGAALSTDEIKMIYNRQKQEYVGHYDSPIMDFGLNATFYSLAWVTDLPYLKELTATIGSELTTDYSNIISNTMDNIIAYWNFNETLLAGAPDGSDVEDLSGNGHHLKLYGGVEREEEGVFGNGMRFDGVDDYAKVDKFDLSSVSELTLSIWYKWDSYDSSATHNLIELTDNSTSNAGAFVILPDSSGSLEVGFQGPSGSNYQKFTTLPAEDTWQHLAFTIDTSSNPDELKTYFNGELQTPASSGNNNYTGNFLNDTLYFMSRAGSGSFGAGALDEIGVWSRKLSASEIKQIYRRGGNRVKIQLRSCASATCSANEAWKGASSTVGKDYFSELSNCNTLLSMGQCDFTSGEVLNVTSPNYLFSRFLDYSMTSRRYFQYRVLMESNDKSSSPVFPSLSSISLAPERYYIGSISAVTNTGYNFTNWTSLTDEIEGSCTTSYQVSLDKVTWYYHNGSSWAIVSLDSDANTTTDVTSNSSSFKTDVGSGAIYLKVFLNSTENSSCQLNSIRAWGE